MIKTPKRHCGAMSSNYMPNFINISGIVLALWPYNQSGTPARSARSACPPARDLRGAGIPARAAGTCTRRYPRVPTRKDLRVRGGCGHIIAGSWRVRADLCGYSVGAGMGMRVMIVLPAMIFQRSIFQ